MDKREAYCAHSGMYVTALSEYEEDYVYKFFQEFEKSNDSFAIADKIIEMFIVPTVIFLNQTSFERFKLSLEFLIANPPDIEDVDELNAAAAYLFGLPEDKGALNYLFNRVYDEFFKGRDVPPSIQVK
ncbi:hypothetical protein GAO09_03385 [Rhizobiales bacterium RZME27]|jgi:hypothetical protein|uniref:Uncharacterized protein n=1 Tax=Endobacterium cereale TaxID=2663029 RepID=A0A6A8A2Q9_9HYPH|nr:hypothetical protein [Endobacterium cereale]MEB2844571.1 hypothetical protein [Endobacterium cereale]MQY45113.1 hypothetical protein [Endobacterium cereale]